MKIKYFPEMCTGCSACRLACCDQRDVDTKNGQKPLCRIETVENEDSVSYRFMHCLQCGKCIDVCKKGCIKRNEAGFVVADAENCTGCRLCAFACPVNVISFRPSDGKIMKCDGCTGRVEAGHLPACVHKCPTGALTFI